MHSSATKHEVQRLLQDKKIAEARDTIDNLCRDTPGDAEVWLISASIHAQLGNLARVIECCEKAIELQPDNITAHYNLAIAYQSAGNLPAAEKALQATLRLKPDMYSAKVALGYVALQLGRAQEAINIYSNLLSGRAPGDATIALKANINLSLALIEQKRFSEAEQACNNALTIDPASAEALNNLGQALSGQGKVHCAINAYRKAVNAKPDFTLAHSNYLLDLNLLANIENSEIFSAHCQWGIKHAAALPVKQHSNIGCDSARRLRVGYVSPDFRAHSVVLFIAGLIEAHNRNNVETVCYSGAKFPDAFTEQIRKTSDHWRETGNINDERLARIIEKDKIDILVDLAGHTANNRLLAFARKPAPIQVTWLGYPNTSGLTSIDYRLTDEWVDPPGASDQFNTETLIRLPGGFLCYRPLNDSPPVNNLPMLDNGNITFGSFNNSAKINTDVIKLWARLLRELPESRLVLKSMQLSDPPLKQRYLTEFEQAGIDPSRIEVHGRIASTVDHLALYRKIDLALDPFPYNGTTTTCEALWMGVPVVALEGTNHASRVGVSLLTNAGLTELLAKTQDDYVRICTELAGDPERLSRLRMGMRDRLKKTTLLDAKGFVGNIENAYRDMWRSFCNQQ